MLTESSSRLSFPNSFQLPIGFPPSVKRGSMDGSPMSPKVLLSTDSTHSQDSGKESSISDVSGGSFDVQNLIDFDNSMTIPAQTSSFLADLDPLSSTVTTSVPTTSVDSLFSDTVSSIKSGFSSSPENHPQISPRQSFTGASLSPRQSIGTVDVISNRISMPAATPSPTIVRPRPHSGRGSLEPQIDVTTSAPTSRPTTPKLARQSASSPTGSVQSLPYYPTYGGEDCYSNICYSDSSNNSSILDLYDPLFTDENNDIPFNLDPFVPPSL